MDLGAEHPEYFIAPRWWVRNDIWQEASAYLAFYEEKHGYTRESEHHAIVVSRVGHVAELDIDALEFSRSADGKGSIRRMMVRPQAARN